MDDGAVFDKIKQQIDKLVTSHSLFCVLSSLFPCLNFPHTMFRMKVKYQTQATEMSHFEGSSE